MGGGEKKGANRSLTKPKSQTHMTNCSPPSGPVTASLYLGGLGGRKNTGDWPSCATTEWGRELPNDGGQAAAAASPAPAARQQGVHQGGDAPGRVQAQLGGHAQQQRVRAAGRAAPSPTAAAALHQRKGCVWGQTRVPADRVQQAAHRVGPAIPDDSPRIPPV